MKNILFHGVDLSFDTKLCDSCPKQLFVEAMTAEQKHLAAACSYEVQIVQINNIIDRTSPCGYKLLHADFVAAVCGTTSQLRFDAYHAVARELLDKVRFHADNSPCGTFTVTLTLRMVDGCFHKPGSYQLECIGFEFNAQGQEGGAA